MTITNDKGHMYIGSDTRTITVELTEYNEVVIKFKGRSLTVRSDDDFINIGWLKEDNDD